MSKTDGDDLAVSTPNDFSFWKLSSLFWLANIGDSKDGSFPESVAALTSWAQYTFGTMYRMHVNRK